MEEEGIFFHYILDAARQNRIRFYIGNSDRKLQRGISKNRMKIKVTDKNISEVRKIPAEPHIKPVKQSAFWRKLMETLSAGEMKAVGFECEKIGMDKLSKDEPALFLMNHSSFTDLQMAATMLSDRQYHIVMTDDGMVGKASLMRTIGCIPTKKFIQDTVLVKDIVYSVKKLNSSILMFPEASYSFDGTATPLPRSLAKLIKLLDIPVVMIRTHGSFLRDPLYNNLRKRQVKVTATEEYLLSKEDIDGYTVQEIAKIVKKQFTFDYFREQTEENITVSESFRADNLERVLYKCPSCNLEGTISGRGTEIVCANCGEKHTLLENGQLENENGETRFKYVTDWYAWERDCVRKEIENGDYSLDIDVDILMLVDSKSMYRVGRGHLVHDRNGFVLTGCDGELEYRQGPNYSYSLYADYYWYEIGDMVCIGDTSARYYCFPKTEDNIPVAKARIATEEIYKSASKK